MRKLVTRIFSIILLSLFLTTLSSCSLFLSDGYTGIYTLTSYSSEPYESSSVSFGDKYDYIIMIVRENGTATFKYKLFQGEEGEYSTKYTVEYDSEDPTKVNKIIFDEFYTVSKTSVDSTDPKYDLVVLVSEADFVFRPKLHNLNYNYSNTKIIDKHFRTQRLRCHFHKMFDKITDKNIEKAINKNIRDRLSRAASSEEE